MAAAKRNPSPADVFPALWKELADGDLRPVYILYGPREARDLAHIQFLFDRTVSTLRQRFASDPAAKFNQDIFHGGQVEIDQVLGAARTVPMFGDYRLTILVDQPELKDKALDDLVAYIKEPSPSTILMVAFASGKLSRKIHNACKKTSCLFKAEKLKERDLVRWIDECFSQHGVETEPGASRCVAEYTGADLRAVEDTVEKLAIYTAGRARVTTEDVEQCVLAVRQSEIFDLLDCIGERNAGKALHILGRLAGQKTESLFINAMLSRTLRNLIKIRKSVRIPPRDAVARDLGVHPFVAGKLITQARNFSMKDLEKALAASAEFNVRSKRSRVAHERLMEDMVLTIISGQEV